MQARQTSESSLLVRLGKNSFGSSINLRKPFLNQWKKYRMDNHHKDPLEDSHHIHAHGKYHTYYKIHNIEVAQTPEFFLG